MNAPPSSVDELVKRASEIGLFARGLAGQVETDRRVSSETIARMRKAGLFQIMMPALNGGYEYGFDALVRVVVAVAAGCCSTGWVFSLGIFHQWLVAAFPRQAQDEYFSDPDAIAFGSYPPLGLVRSLLQTEAIFFPAFGVLRAAAIMRNGLCWAAPYLPRGTPLQSLHFSCCQLAKSGSMTIGIRWTLLARAARTRLLPMPSYPGIASSP
jgi:hypothetical protein